MTRVLGEADLQGVTPLFAAAEAGHSPVVHLLLQAGADRYKARRDGVGLG